jgi:hypothetical protein
MQMQLINMDIEPSKNNHSIIFRSPHAPAACKEEFHCIFLIPNVTPNMALILLITEVKLSWWTELLTTSV